MSIRAFIVSFVCLPAASVLADFQVVEDFAGLDLGNVNGQDQWVATAGTADVVADPVSTSNQVLAVSTNSGLVRNPMTVLDGEAHMMFFRLRFAEQQKYSIGLSHLLNPSEFSDYGPELGMANASNDLHVWDDTAVPNYVELTTLTQDTWYNVWVMVDNAADQYRVWVNDVRSRDAGLGDQLDDAGNDIFDFRVDGTNDLIKFFIKTGGGGAPGAPEGPVYIDDIYLESIDGAVNLHNPLPVIGDLDGDGFVGINDLNIVLGAWNLSVPPADPLADPSGDGFVGIADLNLVLGNWNTGNPPLPELNIPEPGAFAVLGLMGLGLLRRR